MLSIQNLSFSYGAMSVLDNITMSVPEARVTCIIGRNGVGKTTLLMNAVGLLRPSGGSVWLGGDDVTRLTPEARARAGLALVPQGRRIFPNLTVQENLQIGLEARADGSRTVPGELYDLFPILDSMAGRMGGNLSGGQQQQLAIARALVTRPRVLMLDEPTEGIQPNIIQEIGRVLNRLVEELGIAVVMVEQYLDFVKEVGHGFYLMDRRRVVAEGPTRELTTKLVHQHLRV